MALFYTEANRHGALPLVTQLMTKPELKHAAMPPISHFGNNSSCSQCKVNSQNDEHTSKYYTINILK